MVNLPVDTISRRVETLERPPQPRVTSNKLIFFIGFVPLVLVVMFLCAFIATTPEEGPNDYCRKQTTMDCSPRITVFAGHLTSDQTTRDLDYDQVGMCLGQGLQVGSYHLLNYEIDFSRDEDCKQLCSRSFNVRPSDWINGTNELSNWSGDDARQLYTLTHAIKKNYQQKLNIDNMPVTWCYAVDYHGKESMFCDKEFPIGCYVDKDGHRSDACVIDSRFSKPDTFYLFNHLEFLITYNEQESWESSSGPGDGRITSIKVVFKSIDHSVVEEETRGTCGHTPMAIDGSLSNIRALNVTYSYSVSFVKDNSVSWIHRWDYIHGQPSKYETYWTSNILFSMALISLILASLIMIKRGPRRSMWLWSAGHEGHHAVPQIDVEDRQNLVK